MTTKRGLLHKLKTMGAKAIIVQRELNDPAETEFRRATCDGCVNYFEPEDKCVKCGCIIAVKSIAMTNLKLHPRTNQLVTEVTHCPEGFWNDAEIAEIYRKEYEG